jgi:hypothetical protein
MITMARAAILAGLARCRVVIDRHRHRECTTKSRPAFPAAGPHLDTRTARTRGGRVHARSGSDTSAERSRDRDCSI